MNKKEKLKEEMEDIFGDFYYIDDKFSDEEIIFNICPSEYDDYTKNFLLEFLKFCGDYRIIDIDYEDDLDMMFIYTNMMKSDYLRIIRN